jgi:hypothetical protein
LDFPCFFTRSEQLAHDARPSERLAGGSPGDPVGYVSPDVTLDRDEVRRERLLKNEQVFRDYNNRRVAFEQDASTAGELVPFVCECGDPECVEGMEMTVDDFISAHSAPDRFAVKPGHVFPEGERVVDTHDRFWLVEKDGAGA